MRFFHALGSILKKSFCMLLILLTLAFDFSAYFFPFYLTHGLSDLIIILGLVYIFIPFLSCFFIRMAWGVAWKNEDWFSFAYTNYQTVGGGRVINDASGSSMGDKIFTFIGIWQIITAAAMLPIYFIFLAPSPIGLIGHIAFTVVLLLVGIYNILLGNGKQ